MPRPATAAGRRKPLYALVFPFLLALSWLGQWSRPRWGAGVLVVARKRAHPGKDQRPPAEPRGSRAGTAAALLWILAAGGLYLGTYFSNAALYWLRLPQLLESLGRR